MEKSTRPPPPAAPTGEIVLRTVAMPADTNANGDVFGGWLMSQMDIGGAVAASQQAGSRVVTVSVETMNFVAPVRVGDLVTCYARVLSIGHTSLRIDVEAWAQSIDSLRRVTEGVFTYVAIDAQGHPQPVKR